MRGQCTRSLCLGDYNKHYPKCGWCKEVAECKDIQKSTRELLEFIINRTSYLTMKPEYGGEWTGQCVHASRGMLCKTCQQEQCDSARGGIPEPSEYKWKIIRMSRK